MHPSITAELARQHRTQLQHDANCARLARLATRRRASTYDSHSSWRPVPSGPSMPTIRTLSRRIGQRFRHASLAEPSA